MDILGIQCSAFGFSHRSITQIPSSGLNASVAHLYPQSGTTAVVFQSSALCAGVLDWAAQHVPAIVQAWFPGIEAGPALANILYGDANPSGKLPVSLPYAVGQEPLYLAQLPTGRPATGVDLMHPPQTGDQKYVSRYLDAPNAPLFPYGFGLSYTNFNYGPVTLSAQQISAQKLQSANAPTLTASVEVRNAGAVAGTEVVQLYLRIRGASMEEPVRQLEGFQRITLAPGESQRVNFSLGFAEMSFINAQSQRVVESGTEYTVFIGGSSLATQSAELQMVQ